MTAPGLQGIASPRRLPIVLFFICVYLRLSAANSHGMEADADVSVLKSAGIPTDGPALAAYFKKRTISISKEERIKELVLQLGDDEFKKREEASRQLVMFGLRARPFLQAALKDSDPEIVRRAHDCLERIARGTSSSSLSAAVRVLARYGTDRRDAGPTGKDRRDPGSTGKFNAAAVLLNYLPVAEDERVAETIYQVLPGLAARDGKPEPALVAALTDESVVKRAAAAAALAALHHPDAMPRVRKLLHDRESPVRLRVGLALAAHGEKEAMPVLIRLLDELPWRDTDAIMNLLERLAGETMPALVYGPDAASHRKYREAWEQWWKEKRAKMEPDRVEQASRPRGHTLVVLLDVGVIQELDASNQIRWKIANALMPLDAQLLPGGQRVLLAEYRANRVADRNLKGEIVWKRTVSGPLMAQRLANGNTFIATRNQLFEIDKDGKLALSYSRPDGGDFMRATKLRNGDIACIVQYGGMLARYVRLTPSGKDFNEAKSWDVQVRTSGGRVEVLPNGHVLIPEMDNNRVVEYDADGQTVWETAIDQPIAVMRLPNGNTLVTLMRANRAVEVDRTGKEVWQFKAESRVTRAFRR